MLINCAVYQEGKKLKDIPKEAISDYLARPGCFVWVAMKDPEPAELAEMQQEFGLHELAVEDARHGHQRPKIEEYEDSLFAVIQTVDLENDDVKIGEVDIFVGRNYVLSVRSRYERDFKSVRLRCEAEPENLRHGAGFVFYALIDKVVDRYFPILEELESELEKIEENIFVRTSARSNIQALYYVKQKLMTLRHAVVPLMESVGKLYGGRVPSVCAGTQNYFRDVYDHLHRIAESIDSSRDMLTTAIQVNLSMIALSDNEVTKRLAAWAAIIAVPTMVAGIYGMNFKNMPELDWSFGYPLTIVVMVVIDIFLYWRFKQAKWL